MKCNVLTEERWKKLLGDQLTAEESLAIQAHLDTECPDCEEFLDNMNLATEESLSEMRADLLSQEQATHSGIVRRDIALPIPVAGIRQGVMPIAGTRHHLSYWFGSIAALLVITVGVLPQLQLFQPGSRDVAAPAGFEKAKGADVSNDTFKLDFSTGYRQQDGRLVVERGQAGEKYREDTLLFLQYEASASGYLYLIGVQAGVTAKMLYPIEGITANRLPPGEYNISSKDEVVAYPLAGLHGRYTVVGIFSPRPLEMDNQAIRNTVQQSLNPSTGAIDKKALKSIGGDVAVDTVQFEIGT